jgi:hypothetical protein
MPGHGRLRGGTTLKGTRERLNRGFFQGSLLLACFVGALADSWTVFFIALIVALGCNLYAREIRFGRKGKR